MVRTNERTQPASGQEREWERGKPDVRVPLLRDRDEKETREVKVNLDAREGNRKARGLTSDIRKLNQTRLDSDRHIERRGQVV